jgi:hypothetical protein
MPSAVSGRPEPCAARDAAARAGAGREGGRAAAAGAPRAPGARGRPARACTCRCARCCPSCCWPTTIRAATLDPRPGRSRRPQPAQRGAVLTNPHQPVRHRHVARRPGPSRRFLFSTACPRTPPRGTRHVCLQRRRRHTAHHGMQVLKMKGTAYGRDERSPDQRPLSANPASGDAAGPGRPRRFPPPCAQPAGERHMLPEQVSWQRAPSERCRIFSPTRAPPAAPFTTTPPSAIAAPHQRAARIHGAVPRRHPAQRPQPLRPAVPHPLAPGSRARRCGTTRWTPTACRPGKWPRPCGATCTR